MNELQEEEYISKQVSPLLKRIFQFLTQHGEPMLRKAVDILLVDDSGYKWFVHAKEDQLNFSVFLDAEIFEEANDCWLGQLLQSDSLINFKVDISLMEEDGEKLATIWYGLNDEENVGLNGFIEAKPPNSIYQELVNMVANVSPIKDLRRGRIFIFDRTAGE